MCISLFLIIVICKLYVSLVNTVYPVIMKKLICSLEGISGYLIIISKFWLFQLIISFMIQYFLKSVKIASLNFIY